MALKRPALGFGHFVFALGGVNTYSSFIKIFEDFSNFEDMDSCGLWWMGVRHCYYFGYIQGMY